MKNEEPRIIQGDIVVDDRGYLGFINDFHFEDVKRFYLVSNHKSQFVRAWHGHKKEAKYICVIVGSAIIGAVKIDDWSKPSKDARVYRFVLSDKKPALVHIPPGYANGFMGLTSDTKLVVFSTASLDESKSDDIRFDARYWDIWKVLER